MSISATRLDLWPAELITDPDAPDPADRRRVYPVRVVVTLDEILVWEDGRPPRLVFRDGLVSYSPAIPPHRATKEQRNDPSSMWAVATTDSGHALTFTRASGCGCGSRLKLLSLQSLLNQAEGSTPETGSAFTAVASTRDA